MKTPYIVLILFVAICLVPYGWIASLSPVLQQLFNQVFAYRLAHIIGHSIIFVLIGALALWLIPALRRWPVVYLGLILLAALGQEGFQVLYKGQLYLADSLGDMLVDLVAAALIWMLAASAQARTSARGGYVHDPPAGSRG